MTPGEVEPASVVQNWVTCALDGIHDVLYVPLPVANGWFQVTSSGVVT
jgi:hypothetical protein